MLIDRRQISYCNTKVINNEVAICTLLLRITVNLTVGELLPELCLSFGLFKLRYGIRMAFNVFLD